MDYELLNCSFLSIKFYEGNLYESKYNIFCHKLKRYYFIFIKLLHKLLLMIQSI